MKIALVYIVTGEYKVFWNDFFSSFEKYFLPEMDKEYFVFSDVDELPGVETGRVHIYHIDLHPWPIPTLLKYHTFLMAEDKLKDFDYIYNPNANSICKRIISAKEFLPRRELGEVMMVTTHPGLYFVDGYYYDYCRDRDSMAYVPYNKGTTGVFGAMNGGCGKEFIAYMHEIVDRCNIDLKKCIIPSHHDESYLNNYLVRHKDDGIVRFLPCDFGKPAEWDIPFEPAIELADKNKYIHVDDIKNLVASDHVLTFTEKVQAVWKNKTKKLHHKLLIARDTLLMRKEN